MKLSKIKINHAKKKLKEYINVFEFMIISTI